jgi:DNA-binding MarR family transcriptional regulator/GNAT superfamily N-acetyltransferase
MTTDLVSDIRAFNRFYTRQIGLLNEHFNDSRFSLPEGRVLYEIASRGHTTLAEIARSLGMDPGYASRLLHKLVGEELAALTPNPGDRRSNSVALTQDGSLAFAQLDATSNGAVAELLRPLDETQRRALVAAMRTIRTILGDAMPAAPLTVRPHRLGELGWLIHRQGLLYNQQFGWNAEFEALIAGLYRDFEQAPPNPPKALWIAERNNAVVGSVFVMPSEGREGTAQLRMLYVEPEARGLGIGRMLVDQVVAFSREHGYSRVRLWTQSILASARKIYSAAGFTLVETKPHHSFGQDLVGEIWEREL